MNIFVFGDEEKEELERCKNLIKRSNLLYAHLKCIMNEIENIPSLDKTDIEQVIFNLQKVYDVAIALLHFIPDKDHIIDVIETELRAAENSDKKGVKKHINTIKKNINHDHHAIVKTLNDELHGMFGAVPFILKKIKDMQFPEGSLKKEFIHYLEKMIGVYHELWKLTLKVEKLEETEEANFAELYDFCHMLDPEPNNAREPTKVMHLIHTLEKEF